MRLVDSHCHLQAPAFAHDAATVLAAARRAGVERILVPGWSPRSVHAALELARQHPGLDVAAGVHPHDAGTVDLVAWSEVERLAAHDRVVAVGETGLDYDRAFSTPAEQVANLRRNLSLSARLGKPIVLHCRSRAGQRDAHDALLAELELAGFGDPESPHLPHPGQRGVLHSFSGPPDYAEAALSMGLAVSFSGLVFRRGEEASAEVARLVPLDRLLVETDSPFLSPPGAPRRRNEPEWVRVTAAWLAAERGTTQGELGSQVVANYDRIFGRLDRGENAPLVY